AIGHGANSGRPLPQGRLCARRQRQQRLCCHRLRTAGQGLEGLSAVQKEKEMMKRQRLPRGWTEEEIRKLAGDHDNLTENQHAAEMDAALTDEHQTVMVVPTELVPEIVKLINKKRPA